MYSPSRAEIGESGFSRYDVPVPPSSASSLSGEIKGEFGLVDAEESSSSIAPS